MAGAGPAKVNALYRYPVKGLAPEPMQRVLVGAGETMPYDRAYAIENGKGPFDPAAPAHLPKIHFVMLMRNEQLATLKTAFDSATHELTILKDGNVAARGRLNTAGGRATIEAFIAEYFGAALKGPPRIAAAPGHSFSDVKDKCLHIINLNSVEALGTILGIALNPLRFRPNVIVEGLEAWGEFDLVGQRIKAGGATLEIFKRTERCAATNVDPETGVRDLKIPSVLSRTLGHTDFGVYARVVEAGEIETGSRFT